MTDAPGPTPVAPPPRPPRRRWVTALLCSVIFLAGGVVGGGVTGLVLVRSAQRAIQHPEELPRRIARHLARRLDLDGRQALEVQHILERRQAGLLAARAAALQRAEPELDRLETEIEGVLRPGQVERWRRHYRTLREDWMPRVPRRPARPPY